MFLSLSKTINETVFEKVGRIYHLLSEIGVKCLYFGDLCHYLLVAPVEVKIVDVVASPFKFKDFTGFVMDEREALSCFMCVPVQDELEGKRLVMRLEIRGKPIMVNLWERILRRAPKPFMERGVEKRLNDFKVTVLKPLDYLASKICNPKPRNMDKEKILRFIERYRVDTEELIKSVYLFGHEEQAFKNLEGWFKGVPPQQLLGVYWFLSKVVSKGLREEAEKINLLRAIGAILEKKEKF